MAASRGGFTAARLVTSLLAVFVIAIMVQSVRALIPFADGADVRDLPGSIESGLQPDADYLARFVKNNGLDHAFADCGDAVARASLTVSLAAIDAAIKKRDALGVAGRRLSCNPLDGNALGSGPVPRAIDTPRQVVEARLPFATRHYLAGVADFETEYLDELRRFVTYEHKAPELNVLSAPPVQKLLRPLIEAQPDPRRKALVAKIDRLGVDLSRQ